MAASIVSTTEPDPDPIEVAAGIDILYALSLALVTLQDYGKQYASERLVAAAQDTLMFRLFGKAEELKGLFDRRPA